MNSTLLLENTTFSHNVSCHEDPPDMFLGAKFWLRAIFGSTVCGIGIGFNAALLQVLFQKKLRTTNLIYLAILAIVDICLIITYLLLVVIEVVYEYFRNYTLYLFWHSYIRYFYTLSRVVTLASTYLVLVCTLERYWEVVQLKHRRPVTMTQVKRYVLIACVILGSILFRGAVFLEVEVNVRSECWGTFKYMNLERTWLSMNYDYSKIYSLWIVHMVQVLLPFPALVFLNVAITLTWHKVLRTGRRASIEVKKFVKRSQSARKMMVAIVTSYLICNTLHLFLTIWEHIDMDSLKHQYSGFYELASDTVTLLTAINASVRLPIYYATNSTIRMAIKNLWFAKRVEYVYSRSKASLSMSVKRKKAPSSCKYNTDEVKDDESYLVINGMNGADLLDDFEKNGEIKPLNFYPVS